MKTAKIIKQCESCETSFETLPCYIKRGGGRYCSRPCFFDKEVRKHPKGSQACYKCQRILVLNEENFYRNTSKHNGWSSECKPCHKKSTVTNRANRRKAFIKSKGNMCEKCGIENSNYMFFDLDHINPLYNTKLPRGFIDRDKDNLQVLCPNCHRLKTIKDMEWNKYEV